MPAYLNQVTIAGNITRDIDLRRTASNVAVADLGLAITDKIKQGQDWVEKTTFIDVTLWGRVAEIAAEYCSKGSNVLITGRLTLDTWEQDGQKRSKVKVTAERLQMLGGRGPNSETQERPAAKREESQETAEEIAF